MISSNYSDFQRLFFSRIKFFQKLENSPISRNWNLIFSLSDNEFSISSFFVQFKKNQENQPIKNPGFLEHISQIYVGVEEVWIECDGLFKVVDGQPDLSLTVEHASQIRPGDSKLWLRFDGFQVANLQKIIYSFIGFYRKKCWKFKKSKNYILFTKLFLLHLRNCGTEKKKAFFLIFWKWNYAKTMVKNDWKMKNANFPSEFSINLRIIEFKTFQNFWNRRTRLFSKLRKKISALYNCLNYLFHKFAKKIFSWKFKTISPWPLPAFPWLSANFPNRFWHNRGPGWFEEHCSRQWRLDRGLRRKRELQPGLCRRRWIRAEKIDELIRNQ